MQTYYVWIIPLEYYRVIDKYFTSLYSDIVILAPRGGRVAGGRIND
jgi:hypothetical protein